MVQFWEWQELPTSCLLPLTFCLLPPALLYLIPFPTSYVGVVAALSCLQPLKEIVSPAFGAGQLFMSETVSTVTPSLTRPACL
jgi:hypothetical protein